MSIRFDFRDRTVLVTGAAQGIGHSIAYAFVVAGARVAVVDWNHDQLAEAWGPASDTVLPIVLDVADEGLVEERVREVQEWGNGLDIVVNNAGITRDVVVWRMTQDQWKAVIDVHLTGTFNLTRAAIPGMRANGFGRIINVTSYTGMHGMVGQANYAAAKAGVIGFTKAVAKETARFGITVNAVSPNASTAMVAQIPPDKLKALTEQVPAHRFAEPEEMAPAFLFLASIEAAYITGAVLPVDGGVAM